MFKILHGPNQKCVQAVTSLQGTALASRPSATVPSPGLLGPTKPRGSNPQGDPSQPSRGCPAFAQDLPSSAGAPRPSLGVQQPFSTALEASGGVSAAPSPSAGAPPFCPPAGLPSSGWGSLRFSKSPLGNSSEGPESWAMDGDLEVTAGSFGVSLLSTWKDKREGRIKTSGFSPFCITDPSEILVKIIQPLSRKLCSHKCLWSQIHSQLSSQIQGVHRPDPLKSRGLWTPVKKTGEETEQV